MQQRVDFRTPSKTSTVLSKTTQKVILKKKTTNGENVENVNERRLKDLQSQIIDSRKGKQEEIKSLVTLSPVEAWARRVGIVTARNPDTSATQKTPKVTDNQTHRGPWGRKSSCHEFQRPARYSPSAVGPGAPKTVGLRERLFRSNYQNHAQDGRTQYTLRDVQNRRTDNLHPRNEYKEGIIFSTHTHEHGYQQNRIDPRNSSASVSKIGVVNSKYRKFVVVSCFGKHVIALPVYTHQGRGLVHIEDKQEWVSIRESSLESSAAPAETEHGILWATIDPRFEQESAWHKMNSTAAVHFTAPYTHKIWHKCTISGALETASLLKLLDLYRAAVLGDLTGLSLPSILSATNLNSPSMLPAAEGRKLSYSQALTAPPRRS